MSVTPADLTGTERAVLLVLMAESRPVPNPDLIALGPRLEKTGRDKLNNLGLIESDRFPHLSAWWTWFTFSTAWLVAAFFVRRQYL